MTDQLIQATGLECPRIVQDKLVSLYFEHIHNSLPFILKDNFLDWYKQLRQNHHPGNHEVLLLEALFFAALPYLDDTDIMFTPFESVKEGQKVLFNHCQEVYHQIKLSHRGSQLLVQSTLLMSLWSPFDSTKEVNMFWVNEAISQAVAGGISSRHSYGQQRIIWWCCVIRNRMVSTGLRQHEGLMMMPTGRLPAVADFELDGASLDPKVFDQRTQMAQAFVYFCRLTELLSAAARIGRVFQWREANVVTISGQMKMASDLEEKLNKWIVSFQVLFQKARERNSVCADLLFFNLQALMHQ